MPELSRGWGGKRPGAGRPRVRPAKEKKPDPIRLKLPKRRPDPAKVDEPERVLNLPANWEPWPGPQMEYLKRGEYEVLFGGAKGPGKSDCLIADATTLIDHPHYHGLILRRTFPRLQEIIDRTWDLYRKLGGEYRSSQHRWYFPSGAKITLGHCQHEESKRDYHGKEFHFIGFDELTEFTKTQYLFILANVRKAVGELSLRIRSTTNPGGGGHVWVKERFVDLCQPKGFKEYTGGDGETHQMVVPGVYIDPLTLTSRCFVPATVYDNPSIMVNDPGYVKRLEALPEIEKKRFLFGDWTVFEGQVFTELSQIIHGCEPFEIPPEWEKFMAFDWGFAKPFSVGWYAIDYDGVLYRYREWYGCKEGDDNIDVGLRMSNHNIAQGIFEREREKIKFRVADPACWSKKPQKGGIKGPSVIEDLEKEGLYFVKADNNRILGKNQVHERMRMTQDVDPYTNEVIKEYPRLVVFNDQKYFWKTIPDLRGDPRNPEDVDTDQCDHIYDEFRYACMARPIVTKVKPKGPPPGTFKAERNRLLNAKKYAIRHGVSLAVAYGRVR